MTTNSSQSTLGFKSPPAQTSRYDQMRETQLGLASTPTTSSSDKGKPVGQLTLKEPAISIPITGTLKLKKRHKKLLKMLSYCRPEDSDGEMRFIEEYIWDKFPKNQWMDDYGNIHISIGKSKTIFSAHTDTVHRKDDDQEVLYDPNTSHAFIDPQGSSNCLGADDGAGVWLMMEMIQAGIPGRYIFHRAEEVGGKGSAWVAKNLKDLLKNYERAIAFDRMGTADIITSQRGGRCCSDEFAFALSKAMGEQGVTGMSKATGTFTDTANYIYDIHECTNLSVGYYKQHGKLETLDLNFLENLRTACLKLDWEALPTVKKLAEKPAPAKPYTREKLVLKDTPLPLDEGLDFADEIAHGEDIMIWVKNNPHAATKLIRDQAQPTYLELAMWKEEVEMVEEFLV